MVKSNNKGFSLVEIIIAAAVFAILVYPITRALMMSVNTETQSTKKQYAVEKAEEIMENFKTAELSSSVSVADVDKDGVRYTFVGSWSDPKPQITLPDGDKIDYTKVSYDCNDISLGTSFEKYNCKVEVNDAAYQAMKKGYILTKLDETTTPATAEFKQDSSGNTLKTDISATGTVRNLDSKQAAIIATATYTGRNSMVEENNLDNDAYEHFLSAKANVLQAYDVWYSQYLSGSDFFSDDYFSKNTIIEISKLGNKYTVTCKVEYKDNTKLSIIKDTYENVKKTNVYSPSSTYGDGIVFKQEFEDELPPIYLLYAPAICNGAYCPTDTITIDNRISDKNDKVKIYILQTVADISNNNTEIAKRYRQIICEQLDIDSLKDITYSSSKTMTGAKDVSIRTNLATGATDDNLDVYANFKVDSANSTYKAVKSTDEDESDEVYMYDIRVTLTDSKNNKTVVTGTRGK